MEKPEFARHLFSFTSDLNYVLAAPICPVIYTADIVIITFCFPSTHGNVVGGFLFCLVFVFLEHKIQRENKKKH